MQVSESAIIELENGDDLSNYEVNFGSSVLGGMM